MINIYLRINKVENFDSTLTMEIFGITTTTNNKTGIIISFFLVPKLAV